MENRTKYCMHCGEIIDYECVVCPKCGKQVAELKQANPGVVINNSSNAYANANAAAINYRYRKPKNKWTALLLCIFTVCGHKFYEGKIGMGILYLLTFGLFGFGVLIDAIILLTKPNPYYV